MQKKCSRDKCNHDGVCRIPTGKLWRDLSDKQIAQSHDQPKNQNQLIAQHVSFLLSAQRTSSTGSLGFLLLSMWFASLRVD